ncbi:helix-turn-helix domain-containing protein [Microcoleus sp. PH2017_27_LUM_O_A]|uniref:winged helix-turn-helix domain-containing protein n=1 Tax=Microcoleus sp. PH2017_27_LUM_O_A TaxID=2798837 RepID=UPI0025D5D60F|nr:MULTISPECIES: helix-turn-helix domain-containing protein [unclassified Microcoleus]
MPSKELCYLNPYKLTAMEFKILHFLASHPGESWSRQQIIEKIWGWKSNCTSEERVVEVHIGQIRKKMAKVDATVPNFIQTVRDYGYRFDPNMRSEDRAVETASIHTKPGWCAG